MSISCEDIINSFKDFDVHAITQDKNGIITLWETDKVEYIENAGGWWFMSFYKHNTGLRWCKIGSFFIEEFRNKEPKECLYIDEKPIDYSKWIGKLCWFWDRNESISSIGTLTNINISEQFPFRSSNGPCYKNCKPVSPDEVEFVKE